MEIKNCLGLLILIQLTLVALIIKAELAVSYDRPSLLYREEWQEIPAATPVTQEHISHENLMLNLYGSAKESRDILPDLRTSLGRGFQNSQFGFPVATSAN